VVAGEKSARAVFLDRDGVIVTPEFREGRSFAPKTLDAFHLYESAPECLKSLKDAGFLLVVVTNQPDVGKGDISLETLDEMHRRMREALPIDDIRVCIHTREEGCSCRKPRPGMLTSAATALGIALDRSFMIGDRESDVAAGRAAGCQTVFIDLDYAAEPKPRDAHFTVRSLEQATACILAQPRE
jgi:D-glycero-D-manno-heptose 1,7-bisphosphate phosphatase